MVLPLRPLRPIRDRAQSWRRRRRNFADKPDNRSMHATRVPHDADRNRRRSIRLTAYDYARTGAYFVTICARDRECLFGVVEDGEMRLSPLGRIVDATWSALPRHYRHVVPDAFVVMPNHVHGIIVLVDDSAGVRAGLSLDRELEIRSTGPSPLAAGSATQPHRHPLPEIVRAFKTFSARQINQLRRTPGTPVWQRNYYEHVIRDERALGLIRRYIRDNPGHWEFDPLYLP